MNNQDDLYANVATENNYYSTIKNYRTSLNNNKRIGLLTSLEIVKEVTI
jgi:hypothetical protein